VSDARRTYAACLLLAIAALAAYWNSLNVPFLFDDHESIDANPTIKNLGALGEVLNPPKGGSGVTGRPLVNLSLAINYAIGGTAPRGYHVMNLLIHLGAGLALFGVVRRTLLLPALRERYGAVALPFAWVVAAIWMLHPLQTESVTCVIQRTELLVGLFYLLTFYCFVRRVEAGDGTTTQHAWAGLCIAACALGMASKEVMVSAPLLVLVFDYTFVAGSLREAWKQRRGLYLGLAGTWVLLGFLVAQLGGTRGAAAGLGLGVSPFAYALKQCEAILRYLWLSVWPYPMNVDYGEDLSVHPFGATLGAVLIVALAVITVVGLRRRRAYGFLGMWFFAILSPSSSVIPLLTQTVAEHRMYLPLAAVVVAIVVAWEKLPRPGRIAAAGGAIALLGTLTAFRNHDYRSTIAIWEDTVAKSPRNSRAHHNLGVALAYEGRSAEAIECFKRSLACKPTDAAAHFSLAHELALQSGGEAQAIGHYEAALRILPGHRTARTNLALLLAKNPARLPEAVQMIELEVRVNPTSGIAHNACATILSAFPERLPEARAHAEQAVRLEPANAQFHLNLATLLKSDPARLPEVLAHYEQALRLAPDFFQAHYALANELANLPGRAPDAITHYQAALALQPKHPIVRYNLGVVLANAGRKAEAIREFETVLQLNPAAADAREALKLLSAPAN
jgi:tetratricopeptide (TPR) repeat protein